MQTWLSGDGDRRQTLVVVFLRGGADGLSLVAPPDDDGYRKARPRIALTRSEGVALDERFVLDPRLRDLEPVWRDGRLAVVHAAGSEDTSRSHFEAQDLMEHGGPAGGGWLARFLRFRPGSSGGPLEAVAVGTTVPEALRGSRGAVVLRSLEEFSLGRRAAALTRELGRLYAFEGGALAAAGRDTLRALDRLERVRGAADGPRHGAEYGADEFSQGLRQIARLVRARVGVEAVSIDLPGWDSHVSQTTIVPPLLLQLGRGLSAFSRDLGSDLDDVTVVVMTEFGRRLVENSAFGTDHGRGSVMFVLGGDVRGGRVLGHWPGLDTAVLEGPGDLLVTTNYRNVLAPVLVRHGAGNALGQVFPDFPLTPLPLY